MHSLISCSLHVLEVCRLKDCFISLFVCVLQVFQEFRVKGELPVIRILPQSGSRQHKNAYAV